MIRRGFRISVRGSKNFRNKNFSRKGIRNFEQSSWKICAIFLPALSQKNINNIISLCHREGANPSFRLLNLTQVRPFAAFELHIGWSINVERWNIELTKSCWKQIIKYYWYMIKACSEFSKKLKQPLLLQWCTWFSMASTQRILWQFIPNCNYNIRRYYHY